MYAHILVPLDGSERAERALPVAARIARATGARITMLQALTMPAPAGAFPASAMLTASQIAAQQAAVAGYLTGICGSPVLSGLDVTTQVATDTPAAAILATAQEGQAGQVGQVDLIVLCSHGRSGISRWVLGSVAEHVARHATAPVLVLRESGPIPTGPHPDPEQPIRILVPLDGSALAEAALDPAADTILALAGPHGGALHLTAVLTAFETDPASMPEGLALVGARTYLARIADRLRAGYPQLTVTWSITTGFDTADALLRVAEMGEDAAGAGPSSRCDLIAMATHGRTGVARWALGSITERVLHASTLPLLIVRPLALVHPEQAPIGSVGLPVTASGSAAASS
jgi:nucleotide-binding universal stress UspA family protein